MDFTKENLENQALAFNNEHRPEEEAFEVVLDYNQLSTWDNPYKLFVNGELEATFKSFKPLQNRANKLIEKHNLMIVSNDVVDDFSERPMELRMNNKGPFAPF